MINSIWEIIGGYFIGTFTIALAIYLAYLVDTIGIKND